MEPFHSTLSHSEELKLFCKRKPEMQSINQFYQEDEGSQCNYCHKGLSYSWGLVSPNYEPYTYQTMMERGWRRCGTYYYKLDLQKSCCKQWTHRMDINEFKIKKDQKKTIKRMMTWVYDPIVEMKEQNTESKQQKQHKPKNQSQHVQNKNHNQKSQSTKLITQLSPKTQQFIKSICFQLNTIIEPLLNHLISKQKLNVQNQGKPWKLDFIQKIKSFPSKSEEKSDYYCNWGMLLYGINKNKFVKEYPLVEFIKVIKDTIEKVELSQDYKLQLERGGYLLIQLREDLKDYKEFQIITEVKTTKSHAQNIEKIQVESHTQKQNPKMEVQLSELEIKKRQESSQFQKLQPQYKDFKGQLVITSDKITFGRIKIIIVEAEQNTDSWKMYQRYCKDIHGKQQKGLSSYTNFLCQRALSFNKKTKIAKQGQKYYLPAFDPQQRCQKKIPISGTITRRQGCYHMKYYLDQKFIAVGVIDLLPNGLSSVYFFYQPQYKQHRLGVFSSLIEIEYVRYMSITFPQFKYYYLGFYIHDNDKMAYKGNISDYGPFQLLCPITYNFVTVDERVIGIINKIVREKEKNIKLAPQGMQKDPDMNFTTDLGQYIDKNIKLTYRRRPLKLKQINPQFYLPVLILLKSYLVVLGKELFEIFTFTF